MGTPPILGFRDFAQLVAAAPADLVTPDDLALLTAARLDASDSDLSDTDLYLAETLPHRPRFLEAGVGWAAQQQRIERYLHARTQTLLGQRFAAHLAAHTDYDAVEYKAVEGLICRLLPGAAIELDEAGNRVVRNIRAVSDSLDRVEVGETDGADRVVRKSLLVHDREQRVVSTHVYKPYTIDEETLEYIFSTAGILQESKTAGAAALTYLPPNGTTHTARLHQRSDVADLRDYVALLTDGEMRAGMWDTSHAAHVRPLTPEELDAIIADYRSGGVMHAGTGVILNDGGAHGATLLGFFADLPRHLALRLPLTIDGERIPLHRFLTGFQYSLVLPKTGEAGLPRIDYRRPDEMAYPRYRDAYTL
ncbi:MAG: hypothetical protein HY543_08535, partial [Deltaproteobacteria bacterium]|nr:hypothetical protein [Deltaproteobacteria bacterium]